jgi:hypothetical protein
MKESEFHNTVTRIALGASQGNGFALAGSGAIREHGIISRPSEDIDLFTSDTNEHRFGEAVDRVTDALCAYGYDVEVGRRTPQFARMSVRMANGKQVDIDMGMDWREMGPVILGVGAVLSLQDAIGNKVAALYSRAEARDFLMWMRFEPQGIPQMRSCWLLQPNVTLGSMWVSSPLRWSGSIYFLVMI